MELPEGSTWRKHGGAELEPLLVFTTLCVRWLLKFAKGEVEPTWAQGQKGIVPAWQQVPEEAVVSVAQLRRSKWEYGLPVGVLSYGWASRSHPDPTSEQLQRLVPLLEAIVAECDEVGGSDFTWGLMWDFMSLPQRGRTSGYNEKIDDRSPNQLARVRAGPMRHQHLVRCHVCTHAGAEHPDAGWCGEPGWSTPAEGGASLSACSAAL